MKKVRNIQVSRLMGEVKSKIRVNIGVEKSAGVSTTLFKHLQNVEFLRLILRQHIGEMEASNEINK